jgi:hypothetical protein
LFCCPEGFDGYWILKWLLANSIVPKVIFNGSKILQLDVKEFGIKFRDSLNFVPMSLAAWAESCGIDQKKTYFPHSINKPEFWGTVIPFPNRKEYNYENMRKAERKKFLKFYRKERRRCRNRFDVNKTLADYCTLDVSSLKACCEQFRSLFMELSSGICPFAASLTIASLCNFFWRSRILEDRLIAVIQPVTNRETSKKGQKWLAWMAATDNAQISQEVKIGSFFVDGFCAASNTVYEFHGNTHLLFLQYQVH